MKNSILLLIVLILTSCNNDSEIAKSNNLVGKWKWIESSGGINGRIENPTTTGKSILLEFTDSTIKTYENGLLKAEEKFQIQSQNSIFGGQREMIITGSNEFRQSYKIESDNLYLNDECTDCFQSKYIKQ
ncbi:hypothetical protein [Flavobacterium sp.]|jgi:hypothetical protein|uniref:hypothetical protein n=1 Tax=Flavobacterium sp. TaxID=239 RepID=UPI00286F8E85|nr:hypothetical protein [Flavobacterium sp.]